MNLCTMIMLLGLIISRTILSLDQEPTQAPASNLTLSHHLFPTTLAVATWAITNFGLPVLWAAFQHKAMSYADLRSGKSLKLLTAYLAEQIKTGNIINPKTPFGRCFLGSCAAGTVLAAVVYNAMQPGQKKAPFNPLPNCALSL